MARDEKEHRGIQAPGTLVLIGVFFVIFVSLYFAHWLLLSKAWPVR